MLQLIQIYQVEGYSDCLDIEGSPYRGKYNIKRRKKRKPFPKEKYYPEEEKANTLFDLESDSNINRTVINNNNSSKEEDLEELYHSPNRGGRSEIRINKSIRPIRFRVRFRFRYRRRRNGTER